ncbi:MAG: SMC family ATPase [Candidatus Bathyarchaeota archaeon]|nr:SMC family ATPase [Candidatus Bathyarchaeota archaeon]
MKIEVVQLENIRSHVKSTVPFTRGFNCLVGGLGCGKSSVLYSIDFALFGDPVGRSYEYLLREGADYAKVTVQFTQNGNTYLLTRGLRRRGRSIGQDFEVLKLFQGESLIASHKAEAVAEQLTAITGFDRDLWREIVWVRQEHLKELIDAAPRERQKRLDELFGLSDYEAAWSNIAQYLRDYETEKRLLEKDPDVTGKEKLGDEYNRVTEEYTLLEIELQDTQEALGFSKRVLEEADAKLKRLEEKRLAVEELKRREARIHEGIGNAQRNAQSLNRTIEGKRTVLENLRQRRVSMETQMETCKRRLQDTGMPSDQPAEVLRSVLQDFDNHISSLKGEREATFRSLQTDLKRVAQLNTEKENHCPVCLQPLNGEYKSAMLQRIHAENGERQTLMKQLQEEIDKLQRTKLAANEAFTSLQTLASRLEDLKLTVGGEEKNLAELLTEQNQRQDADKDLQAQLDSVRFEIARFDLSDLEAARTQREKAFRQYYATEADVRTKENRRGDLLRSLDLLKDRIDGAQQKVERVEKIGKTVQVLGAIRDAYRSIQPKLRSEFVKVLRNFVQQVLDGLVGGEAPMLNVVVDDTYTPYVKSDSGANREVANLSGGERTLLAFAYRLGLGQLIMQSRTGHGLGMLLLDEPTENLGTEDGSITRLAEAISRFKAIEQIIAVTHSEDFAEKAGHVIVLEKDAGVSKVSIAKGE